MKLEDLIGKRVRLKDGLVAFKKGQRVSRFCIKIGPVNIRTGCRYLLMVCDDANENDIVAEWWSPEDCILEEVQYNPEEILTHPHRTIREWGSQNYGS